jgi:hypothetical protein
LPQIGQRSEPVLAVVIMAAHIDRDYAIGLGPEYILRTPNREYRVGIWSDIVLSDSKGLMRNGAAPPQILQSLRPFRMTFDRDLPN